MSATNTENKPGDQGKHEGAPKQPQGNEQGNRTRIQTISRTTIPRILSTQTSRSTSKIRSQNSIKNP
jgi:hypothetical protein